MAGTQLPPLLLLALGLLLKPFDANEQSTAVMTYSSPSSIVTEDSTSIPPATSTSISGETTDTSSLPSSEADSTTHLSSTDPGMISTTPQLGTVTYTSSHSPSSELTSISHSTHPGSTSFTLHWNFTSLSPGTEPSVRTDQTSGPSGQGYIGAPKSHRNPGVVVAVCLLVSILVIGSVVMAVRCCHKDESKFKNLDMVSLGTVNEGPSFPHRLLE
ncbi:uncharacterized LOC729966 homolog [Cynocephalus volans]|uniref:uncharacterized LOC729966 homolog n=1 Tax=Cynocephalus volans TaxID=110931 RepID=UPI002FCC9EBA